MKSSIFAVCLVSMLVSAPAPAADLSLFPRPETEPITSAPTARSTLRQDLRDFFLYPVEMDAPRWRRLGLGVLAVGAVSILDDEIRTAVLDHSTAGSVDFARTIRPLGQEGGLVLLGLTWASGSLLDRPNLVRASQDGLEATLLAAGIVTPILKVVSGRARPREGLGSSSFTPFSSHQSFPSGEATEAFAIASVLSSYSERRTVKSLIWVLATVVSLQRLELDAHWASDVTAGALIGTGVGHWVARRHRTLSDGQPNITVVPGLGRDRFALVLRASW
jgi:membrane-associated phospholipid phosphatase